MIRAYNNNYPMDHYTEIANFDDATTKLEIVSLLNLKPIMQVSVRCWYYNIWISRETGMISPEEELQETAAKFGSLLGEWP